MAGLQKTAYERATILLYWRLCREHGRQFWLTLLIPISSIAISSVVPLYIGKTLASLQHPTADHLQYLPYMIIVAVIGVLANRVGYGCLLSVQAKVQSRLQQMTLQTLLARGISFHNNRVSGKLVSDANDLQQSFNSLSNVLFVSIIPLSVILVSGVVLVGISSWVLGLALLLMAVTTIGSSALATLGRSGLRERRQRASKNVIAHMADTIVNQQTVKTFAKESGELHTHQKLNSRLLELRLSDWVSASRSNNWRIALLMAFQIAFVVVIVEVTKHNPALLGAGIFAFSYTVTLTNRLLDIGPMIRTIEDGFLQSGPMMEVMAEAPEIKDEPDAPDLQTTAGVLVFDDVSFTYKDSSDAPFVFEHLNLTIKAGEKIGLMGPSGGGKSTLTRILLRFEDIDSGRIAIDGQDISSVTQRSLRESIAYVPQEPLLFHRPIRENIAYGKSDASQEAIIMAAQKAAADGFISSLPASYDTVVGERGVKLSGGQRQRVAIARAILKNAPILVLDEATSALDSESEKDIQLALWELMKDKTAIVIAHRLSTIQRMDRILVLDEGKIIEQGTHAELLKQKGLYARLWKHQSGGFLKD